MQPPPNTAPSTSSGDAATPLSPATPTRDTTFAADVVDALTCRLLCFSPFTPHYACGVCCVLVQQGALLPAEFPAAVSIHSRVGECLGCSRALTNTAAPCTLGHVLWSRSASIGEASLHRGWTTCHPINDIIGVL